jgi:hypothetical protein
MTTQEIYTLANEITEAQFNNVLNGFNQEETKSFETLVRLGDRKEVALFTVISEKYSKLEVGELYNGYLN